MNKFSDFLIISGPGCARVRAMAGLMPFQEACAQVLHCFDAVAGWYCFNPMMADRYGHGTHGKKQYPF